MVETEEPEKREGVRDSGRSQAELTGQNLTIDGEEASLATLEHQVSASRKIGRHASRRSGSFLLNHWDWMMSFRVVRTGVAMKSRRQRGSEAARQTRKHIGLKAELT
jgi:hypothetical protein